MIRKFRTLASKISRKRSSFDQPASYSKAMNEDILSPDSSLQRTIMSIPGYNIESVVDAYRNLYFPDDAAHLSPILSKLRSAAEAHPSIVGHDERLCVEIMRFTNASMALGAPESLVCASEYLRGGLSSCGGYALVMTELARTAGLPARYLGLFGIPTSGSHALCEIHFNGEWHLFDPTFGVFFYSRPQWDGTGHILSTQELMVARQRPTMMQVVEKPWSLNYEQERRFPVQPLLDPPTSHVMTYWAEEGRRTMFPIAFGNDATVSVPVEIDLRNNDSFVLGEHSGKWSDTWAECIKNPANGYFQIGGFCPTIHHCIRIKSQFPGKMTATYVAASESIGRLAVFPLAHCLLLRSESIAAETRFEFFINGPEPSFLLMADQAYWIDTLKYHFHPEYEDAS